jgi:hypothetical protein
VKIKVVDFLTQLDSSHMLGLDHYDDRQEEEVDEEEEDVAKEDTQGSVKRSRAQNYGHKKALLYGVLMILMMNTLAVMCT